MSAFPVNSLESAPEKSKPALQTLQAAFGFIPNIVGTMSSSHVLVNSLVGLFKNVHGGSFTEQQIQTILLTNAVTNRSSYPVALHTLLGLNEKLDPADVLTTAQAAAALAPLIKPLPNYDEYVLGKTAS